MVNMIGRGISVALQQSSLPSKYWGYAAVNTVNIYNVTVPGCPTSL